MANFKVDAGIVNGLHFLQTANENDRTAILQRKTFETGKDPKAKHIFNSQSDPGIYFYVNMTVVSSVLFIFTSFRVVFVFSRFECGFHIHSFRV